MRWVLLPVLLAISAPAASAATGRSATTVTVPLGKTVRINRQVYRPIAIVEDSRCPTRVTCVWRGRLVVEFTSGRQKISLEDGKPLAVPGGRLTLVNGMPHSMRGETFKPQQYRFQLRFEPL